MRELILIHGMSQQKKDPATIKAEWIAALTEGLGKSNVSLPSDVTIRFPYYGDTLFELSQGLPANEVADIIIKGENGAGPEQDFIRSVLAEVSTQTGVSDADIADAAGSEIIEKGPLNWRWVRAIVSVLDRRMPGSGTALALFTKVVYHYIRNPGVRDRIDEGVRKAITTAPTVVVGHSLGTVVAYSLLGREGTTNNWDVPLLATVGSPLAVNTIRKALQPNRHPTCVGQWFNARDKRDIVALYPLDGEHNWDVDPSIENNNDIQNPTSNRHGAVGYLSDPEIARRIYTELMK